MVCYARLSRWVLSNILNFIALFLLTKYHFYQPNTEKTRMKAAKIKDKTL